MVWLQYKRAKICNMNPRERRKPKIPFYVKKKKSINLGQEMVKHLLYKPDSLRLILKTHRKVGAED